MRKTEYSPSGKLLCPSKGPLNAEIVIIAESPAAEEMKQGEPLVGKSGKMLNKALVKAGIDRTKCYVMNCVPVRAPGDKFVNHDPRDLEWGRVRLSKELSRLRSAKAYLTLGANPTEWLFGQKPPIAQRGEGRREGFIGQWRGSLVPISLPEKSDVEEDYLCDAFGVEYPISGTNPGAVIIPTFHPAAILRQMTWHPWFLQDVAKAKEIVTNGLPELIYRQWFYNDPNALNRLADSGVDLIAVDTELDPWIVSITTEDAVHVFEWDERFREPLSRLLTSPKIMKVAHSWLYDYAFIRKCLGTTVAKPMFDTLGGAMILNTALAKELSPHIASRFTNWPYHKWLANINQLWYCGMDGVVCYDAYWNMQKQLSDRKLSLVSQHDHRLLTPLLEMQAKGFKIDESAREGVEGALIIDLDVENQKLEKMIRPVIEKKLYKFEKPHLFQVNRKCECCGGGATQRIHCEACARNTACWIAETQEVDYKKTATHHGFKTIKAYKESFPLCRICHATGKITKSLPFNSDSPDQLADILYRGLGIRPRKFKGNETVKAAQLEPLRGKHEIVGQIVQVSKMRSDLDTVSRLRAGSDGLLHCEFDLWGTGSGRVAGKEGLLEAGTNPMNLTKKARRFVVPRDGYTFLYPDMSQIEARAICVLSGDKTLQKALYEPVINGQPDYHTFILNAIQAYDRRITLSRDQSKRVSYAGFYGVRPEQLAKELTAEFLRKNSGMVVDAAMAATILEVLYHVCPEIRRWQQSTADEVLRTRKLKNPLTGREFTWLGYIVDRKDKGQLDYETKKQVWSRLPQDVGAWVLGLGLMDLYYDSNEWGKLVTPLIHVHDALLIEAPIDRVKEAEVLVLKTLTRYIWEMDFPAEMKRGNNWYEAS